MALSLGFGRTFSVFHIPQRTSRNGELGCPSLSPALKTPLVLKHASKRPLFDKEKAINGPSVRPMSPYCWNGSTVKLAAIEENKKKNGTEFICQLKNFHETHITQHLRHTPGKCVTVIRFLGGCCLKKTQEFPLQFCYWYNPNIVISSPFCSRGAGAMPATGVPNEYTGDDSHQWFGSKMWYLMPKLQ